MLGKQLCGHMCIKFQERKVILEDMKMVHHMIRKEVCVISFLIKENTNNMKWLEKDSGGRDLIERWIDRHNHKLELVRTLGSLIAATTGVLVFLKVFNII